MSAQQFVGSRLKVQRAYRHLDELDTILKNFVKTDFCRVRIEVDPNTGNDLLKMESITALPPEIPLVIGDIVHNLRASLDYVTSQAVGKDIDRVTFPMGKKRDDLVGSSGALAGIQKTLPDFADFIVKTIQPYQGGEFTAWEISQLDNFDKHKLLVPTLKIVRLDGVNVEDENGNRFGPLSFSVGENGVIRAIRNTVKMKIHSYGTPAADIFFSQGSVFEKQPVIRTLLQCARFTLKAIEALEGMSQ